MAVMWGSPLLVAELVVLLVKAVPLVADQVYQVEPIALSDQQEPLELVAPSSGLVVLQEWALTLVSKDSEWYHLIWHHLVLVLFELPVLADSLQKVER